MPISFSHSSSRGATARGYGVTAVLGPTNTGKTHLAIALGVEAAAAASTCSSAIGSLKAITDCYCHLNISHFDNFFLKPHFEHSQNRK